MKAINAAALLVLLALALPARAVEYWSYTYHEIEVTAAGNAGRAVDLAHDLAQLDAAFARTTAAPVGSWRVPVHVYALPDAVFKKVYGGNFASVFANADSRHDILINIDNSNAVDRYWAAYFGYIAGIMATAGNRYPYWYLLGVSSVFAASSISGDRVIIGGVAGNQLALLNRGYMIPMRTVLNMKSGDPQLTDGNFDQLYRAQCWLFVHQVLIEHKYRESVAKYLDLLSEGKGEGEAFSASFNISYDDLDAFMHGLMTTGTLNRFAINLPKINSGTPQVLTSAEVNARLAEFGVSHNHELQDAMQRARDAIAVEPNNERAWRALARGQITQGNYAEALRAVERLSAQTTLSAQGYYDCGVALVAIAQHHADVAVDEAALTQRARDDFEKSIAMNGDDPAPLVGFSAMIVSHKDVEAAKKLVPVVQQAASRNPNDSDLARSTARLCALLGDADCALKFAQAWQRFSKTGAERDIATAYLSRIRTNIERHSAASPDNPN
jgi:tetratricopeptide (TPR) repeat protein